MDDDAPLLMLSLTNIEGATNVVHLYADGAVTAHGTTYNSKKVMWNDQRAAVLAAPVWAHVVPIIDTGFAELGVKIDG